MERTLTAILCQKLLQTWKKVRYRDPEEHLPQQQD